MSSKLMALAGLAVGVVALCAESALAGASPFTGPLPYLSISDSPFFATWQVGSAYYLEDFEDGVINVPGLSVNDGTVKVSTGNTDSVDIDDGALDGSGTAGVCLANETVGTITLQFDNVVLGGYPTQVGFVWTDGTNGTAVTITVVGALGSIFFDTFNPLGDALDNGGTAEDRFFGITVAEGIAQVQVADSGGRVEIDHVQFNAPTPGILWSRDRVSADANSDLVWHNPSTGGLSVWVMNGLVKGGGPASQTTPTSYRSRGMGDFNGDGKADLLFRDISTNLLYVWLMNGQTVMATSQIIGAPALAADVDVIGIGDTDGNGKADIVFRNSTNNNVNIWHMDGVTRTSGALVTLNGGALNSVGLAYAGIGDFNGDGRSDLLWRNASNNLVRGWLMGTNGHTVFHEAAVGNAGPVLSDWVAGAVGDLNGDGRADVIWRNVNTGAANGWLMDGLYREVGGSIGTINASWTLRTAADLNGDGKNDLIWTNGSGSVNGWIMNGLTKVTGGTINTIPAAWSLVNK